MAKATILFADNDPGFLKTMSDFLKQESYEVVTATNPTEARRILEAGEIDLAILDIRLVDDKDGKDTSGLDLARESGRFVPKIILTAFPNVEMARESLELQLDGLPAAIGFVRKDEGEKTLLQAVDRVLGFGGDWIRKVEEAIKGTDRELKEDYDDAQEQARLNYMASFIVALVGLIVIFLGVALALLNLLAIGIVATAAGIITEAIGYLFFKRVDVANERMDRYHNERMEGRHLEMLLQACRGLTFKKREQCRERIIIAATERWLGSPKAVPNALGSDSLQKDVEVSSSEKSPRG